MTPETIEYCRQKLDDLALTYDSKFTELLRRGTEALDKGQYQEAIKLASEAAGWTGAHKELVRILYEMVDEMKMEAHL